MSTPGGNQQDQIDEAEDSFPKTTRPEADERREPERILSSADRIGRNLDAVPDRVDARDFVYQPRLAALPDQLVNCAAVPEVLDQGQEGACTGFALAAVINFLLRQRGRGEERVSPRMLYEMARRYDEWPGEEYVGSSARGGMKGWVRHGVCSRASWQDDQHGLTFFTTEIGIQAMATPGGAFYRVAHRDVRDMHAALHEVGILYVTLMVHEGWGVPGPMESTIEYVDSERTRRTITLPIIQRRGRADSGHAVAIVGYTREGFIIQNSWGPGWGAGGFALLPYEDYMLHTTDVWVAQLGVPVRVDLWQQGAADSTEGLQRATPTIPLAEIRPYVVDVGNNGELSTSGDYWTTTADLERLFSELIPEATRGWSKKRVLLYLHGGLNAETAVARRIVAFRDVLLANEIYPLHIMWETDFVQTLNNMIRDFFTDVDERSGDWLSRFREGLVEARDRTLELTVAAAGTAVWSEMKENARLSSQHPDGLGAMQLLLQQAIAAIGRLDGPARDSWELHVVGHSAGCIYAAHAVQALCQPGCPVQVAPAHGARHPRRRVQGRLPRADRRGHLPPTVAVYPERRRRARRRGRAVRQVAALPGQQRLRGPTRDPAAGDGDAPHARSRAERAIRAAGRRPAGGRGGRHRSGPGQPLTQQLARRLRQRSGDAELGAPPHPRRPAAPAVHHPRPPVLSTAAGPRSREVRQPGPRNLVASCSRGGRWRMIGRDDLHTMLDSIPEDRLADVRAALEQLADPVLVALLNAPEDDEPLTDEDLQAIAEGEEDQRLGRTITLEEYIARRADVRGSREARRSRGSAAQG